MGRIKRNSRLELTIPTSQHVVGAKIDWTCAEPLLIEVAQGETIEVHVSNTHGAMKTEYAITVGRDTYLNLRQI